MRILAGLFLCYSSASLACGGGWQVKFKVPGTTYFTESLTAMTHREGMGIKSGDDVVFYDYVKKRWCVEDQTEKDPKKRDNCTYDKVPLTDTPSNRGIGLIEFDHINKKFYIFSINAKGEKDIRRPYMKFQETMTPNGEPSEHGQPATIRFSGELVGGARPGVIQSDDIRGIKRADGRFRQNLLRGLANDPMDPNSVSIEGKSIQMGNCKIPVIREIEAKPAASGTSSGEAS